MSDVPAVINFAAAGVGGMFGWCVVHPFNTATVRMNLAKASGNLQTSSFRAFLQETVKVNGYLSLYNGLSAGLLRQLFYTSSINGFFEVFKNQLGKYREVDAFSRFIAGLSSGVVAAIISCPAEVTLVRISNDIALPSDSRRNYKGVVDAFQRIATEEGPAAFFRGCGPFVNRAMVVGTVQIGTNDHFKAMYKSWGVSSEFQNVLFASLTSGLLYSLATMPLESAKNRMAVQRPDPVTKELLYRGTLRTIRLIVRNEGILKLWTGFTPYYIRCGGHSVCMFMTSAWLRNIYRERRSSIY